MFAVDDAADVVSGDRFESSRRHEDTTVAAMTTCDTGFHRLLLSVFTEIFDIFPTYMAYLEIAAIANGPRPNVGVLVVFF